MEEGTGLEPVCDFTRQFSSAAATPIWLAFLVLSEPPALAGEFVRDEAGRNHVFLRLLGEKLAGAPGFEPRTSVLETGILPVKLRAHCDFGFWIADFGLKNNRKSKI